MRRADREVTDVDGMIDIIDHCKVCHIALMDGEWPYIVAMNFAYSYENDLIQSGKDFRHRNSSI